MHSVYAQPGSLLWNMSADWYVHDVASTNDINGDGYGDVFVGSGDNRAYAISGGGGTKGDIIWSWNYGVDVWTVVTLPDINGDGINECLAGCGDNLIYCMDGRSPAGTTSILWSYVTGSDVRTIATIQDVNADGYADCLVGSDDDNVYCLSGKWGNLIWSYNDPNIGAIKSVGPISDVNSDGKDDCLAGGQNDEVMCISGGSWQTGSLIWSYKTGSTVRSVARISDVNEDGIDDCLAGGEDDYVYCISGNSTGNATVLWSYRTGATVTEVTPISDVNGDGRADCLAGSQDNKIYCLSGATGSLIWTHTTGSTVLAVATIPDVNGTGGEDCIAGGHDDKVRCIEGKTGLLIWSYTAGGSVTSVSAIADISGNGSSDIIAGSMDSYVYALEGGETAPPVETVSTPSTPSGPSSGKIGQSLTFTTGGSTSNLGHPVEYIFDWGDGTVSDWGTASQSHTYTTYGTFSVKAQARCQTHTDVTSAWSSPKTVALTGYTLTVSISGQGTVTKLPDKTQYNYNESVTLTSNPATGYQFDHWGGALSGNTNPASLTMNGDKNVTAYFTQSAETVSTPSTPSRPSTGKVGQDLIFSTSGATSSLGHPVEYRFDWGDGSFSNWGSPGQMYAYSKVGTHTIKAQARCQTHTEIVSAWSAGKNVTLTGHTLTVTISGQGSVTKSPDKTQYDHNETVTLTPSPASGFQFDHWEGALSGSTTPGTLTMNGDKTVTAYFTESTETVSTPSTPSGPSSGKIGQSLTYTTGGSTSNLGHPVEYIFDWGDGAVSDWGTASQSYTYTTYGSFSVKAQARCQTHTGVTSAWSSSKTVALTGYTLTVSMSGQGTVTKLPDKTQYNHNESVTLTASPATGYQFDHWGGALSGNTNPASLTMNGDKTVTAYFTQTSETVTPPSTPTGPTTGRVGQSLTFSTGGANSNLGHPVQYRFDWGNGAFSDWGSTSQSYAYTNYGTFTVRAQARCQTHTGVVSNWSSGKNITLSGHTLTVSISGQGTVTKNPDKTQYNHEENVTLTPNPAADYQFDHWEGALSGSANPASLTMNGDKTITAYFTQSAETISKPSTPTGPMDGKVGQSLSFTTGGSTSNLGHPVQYRFDWGDGSTSAWGSGSQSHTYTTVNTYTVKAQARCQTHTGVVSQWSDGKNVVLSGHTLSVIVNGQGTVSKNPNKTEYNHGENVTLTAQASENYRFDRWDGDLSGSQNPASLTLTGDKTISAYFLPSNETITTPSTPTGPSIGSLGQDLTFTTGGAVSSLGHPVEYRFDWGDGIRSDWGNGVQSHRWSITGFNYVTAQARCATHTSVVSSWSSGMVVNISDTGVESVSENGIPSDFYLSQNVPNPFNGDTWITFHLPHSCRVRVDIFNVSGKLICTLHEGATPPGAYRIRWDGTRPSGDPVPSGVYLYRIIAGTYCSSKTMMFLK